MFSLAEVQREGAIQTENREEFYLLTPVPEAYLLSSCKGIVCFFIFQKKIWFNINLMSLFMSSAGCSVEFMTTTNCSTKFL